MPVPTMAPTPMATRCHQLSVGFNRCALSTAASASTDLRRFQNDMRFPLGWCAKLGGSARGCKSSVIGEFALRFLFRDWRVVLAPELFGIFHGEDGRAQVPDIGERILGDEQDVRALARFQ